MATLPTWRQMNMDTSQAVEAYYLARLRELPPWRKAEMLSGVNNMALTFALAGIRQRHPEADEAEVRRQLAHLLLGDDLAQRYLAATEAP